jgi:hypothetical protein
LKKIVIVDQPRKLVRVILGQLETFHKLAANLRQRARRKIHSDDRLKPALPKRVEHGFPHRVAVVVIEVQFGVAQDPKQGRVHDLHPREQLLRVVPDQILDIDIPSFAGWNVGLD